MGHLSAALLTALPNDPPSLTYSVVKDSHFETQIPTATVPHAQPHAAPRQGIVVRECAWFGAQDWPRLGGSRRSFVDARGSRVTLLVITSAWSPRKSTLGGMLEEAGFRVLVASTCEEARRALSVGEIELTVVDLCHLEKGGLLTVEALTRQEPAPRMIAISGRSIVPITAARLAVSRDRTLVAALERHPPARELIRVVRTTLRL